jgi:polysaccharide biosynthesis protein PslG
MSARAAAVPAGFVGMNVDGPLYPGTATGVDLPHQFGVMDSAGVESVRGVFDWAYAQPYASWARVPASQRSQFVSVGGVPTRFSQTDRLVGDAAAVGMTVLPTVIYAPSWDTTRGAQGGFGRPARDAPYGRFLTALIARYGPHGSFWSDRQQRPVPIREWEIWNEPNIPFYWPRQPFAKSYAQLLAVAHKAIAASEPAGKVVLAPMTDYSWIALAQLYKIPGVRALFDVVAVHPYTATPAGVITILRYNRDAMNAAGDAAKPIVADEVGWPSGEGQTNSDAAADFNTTEQGQASNIAAVLPLLAANRRKLGLEAFYLYTWAGDETPNAYAFDFAGLFKYAGGTLTAKPAYSAFAQAALALEHCARKGALATQCAQAS